jgi:ribosomal protein L7/L12
MNTFPCPLCGAMLFSEDARATVYCPSCTNTVIISPEEPLIQDPFAPVTVTPADTPEPAWWAEMRRELGEGNKIAAIKVYKDNTGCGLKEAKESVEAIQAGIPVPRPEVIAPAVDHMPAIEEAVRAGRKLEAIKLYREMTGLGLKESKDAVEELERRQKANPANVPQLIPPPAPASGSGCLWLVSLAAALLWGVSLAG